jgi:hypothetical protein
MQRGGEEGNGNGNEGGGEGRKKKGVGRAMLRLKLPLWGHIRFYTPNPNPNPTQTKPSSIACSWALCCTCYEYPEPLSQLLHSTACAYCFYNLPTMSISRSCYFCIADWTLFVFAQPRIDAQYVVGMLARQHLQIFAWLIIFLTNRTPK